MLSAYINLSSPINITSVKPSVIYMVEEISMHTILMSSNQQIMHKYINQKGAYLRFQNHKLVLK